MAKEAIKIQDGDVIDYVATAAIAVGDVVDLTTRVGVAYDDAAIGDTIAVDLEGVFEVTATTADAVAVGAQLYFDTTAREVTTTVASNIPAGMAATGKTGAVAGSVYVRIG